MKIALVSQEYPPAPTSGGIGSQTEAKATGLSRLGHTVTVVTHSAGGRRHVEDVDGVRVLRLPGPDTVMPVRADAVRWLVWSGIVAAELARMTGTGRPDVVEFPEWASEGYVHLLNRGWDILPTVVQLHGPLVMFAGALGWPAAGSDLYKVGRHMERTCLELADLVYSSSETSLNWVRREHGLELRDAPVLHTGVDTDLFAPGAESDLRTVVSVGKLSPSKGVRSLVDACCALLPEVPQLRLRLVGDGAEDFRAELAATAATSGLPLEFCGYLPRQSLPDVLRGAHVFAAPSPYEGGPGLVLLEAMACGLPVVACCGSGASENIRDGRTGRLVAPHNSEDLTKVLRDLFLDPDGAARIGRAGRAHVSRTASTHRALLSLVDVYERTVDLAGARSS